MSSVYRDPPHARGKLAGGRLRLNEYGVRCHDLMRARDYVQRSCARGGRAIDLVQYGCRKGGLGPEDPRRWREKLSGASAHILATRRVCQLWTSVPVAQDAHRRHTKSLHLLVPAVLQRRSCFF